MSSLTWLNAVDVLAATADAICTINTPSQCV